MAGLIGVAEWGPGVDVLIGWPGGDWRATTTLAATIVAGYLALIWVTTVLWTYRDIRARSRDLMSQLIGVALVTALPLVGIPLYLVLRPSDTLQQAYDRQLEQEAILSELHSVSACTDCRRPVQDDFMICPYCRVSLKEPCADCARLMTHAWRHCPYCGTSREPARSAARLEFEDAEPEQGQPDAEPAAGRGHAGPAPVTARPRGASGESAAP